VLVKLNEGVSGSGNALVELEGLPAPESAEERAALATRLREMKFGSSAAAFDTYFTRLAATGGIVEERIAGEEFRSPSVQMRITPTGKLEVLSTHDQLLGGASGQSYLGCRFPADTAYAPLITREAVKIGERALRRWPIHTTMPIASTSSPWPCSRRKPDSRCRSASFRRFDRETKWSRRDSNPNPGRDF
jgi:hypothetical protein